MTLSFKTKFKNGEPTYFLEKIHNGLVDHGLKNDIKFFDKYTPKIHSIREDKTDRWKAKRDIHFVINNRTKDRFQFAPVIKCKSVQTIQILHRKNKNGDTETWLQVDGKLLMYHEIAQLAVNDGFDSILDFLDFFSEDFSGKIIHWTDLKY